VARIVFYMATCAAVPVLRRRVEAPPGAFTLPGGPFFPGLALLVCVAILAGADMTSLIGGGLALVAGAVLYAATKQGMNSSGR
jgi:amino acid transporter